MMVQSAGVTSRSYGGDLSAISAGQDASDRQDVPGPVTTAAAAASPLPSATAAGQLGATSLASLITEQARTAAGVGAGRHMNHAIVGRYPAQDGDGSAGVSLPKLPHASA